MPSPFPGMNPYLEQSELWQQFHGQLMPLFQEQLEAQVPEQYTVRMEQHIYVHELSLDESRRIGRADVSVDDAGGGGVGVAQRSIAAPVFGLIDLDLDEERWSYLEIHDRKQRRIVTVIELLSPSNKRPGDDRGSYLAKRRELLHSPANFIEIDLLRGGPRMPVRDLPPCDYYVMVSRPEDRPRVELWPIGLAEQLPEIPIPLNPGDPEPLLNLQLTLHRAYDAAGYRKFVYDGVPEPPLTPEQAQWVEAFVPQRTA